MKIWIDLVNAPHVRFFSKLIHSHLGEVDSLLVTARDYGYLRSLSELLMPDVDVVFCGRWRETREGKLIEHCSRIIELARLVAEFSPDVAISKASPELARVSFGLGIPSVNLNDNELAFHVSKLVFPLSSVVVVPEVFPEEALRELGAVCRVRKFRGVCEVSHVLGYELPEEVGDDVVVRPEPAGSSYVSGRSRIVEAVLRLANDLPNLKFVLFPRGEDWRRLLKLGKRIRVQEEAVDSIPLLSRAWGFIGAGGTMTREAALLGTPSISMFPGREPSVTLLLEREGLIYRTEDPSEAVEAIIELSGKRKELRRRAAKFISSCEDPTEVVWEEAMDLTDNY